MSLREPRLALFAALAVACSGGPTGPQAPRVAIVYTNNVDGEIEPCG